MTIAELFVAIGIKVDNIDQLTALETTLKNITANARAAVKAIAALNGMVIKPPTVAPAPANAQPAAPVPPPAAFPRGAANPYTSGHFIGPRQFQPPAAPVPPPPSRVIAWTSAAKKLSAELNKVALAAGAATASIIILINKSIDAAMRMSNFGTATALSTDRLQEFQHAAQVGGAAAGDMLALLDSLQLKQAQIALGEGDLSPFAFFGIDPNQDTNKVIDQLRQKLKTFSKEQLSVAREMAARLGVGRDLFAALLRDSQKLQEAFVVSRESIESTQDLNAAWQGLTFRLAVIRNQLVSAIAPAFAKLAKVISAVLVPIAGFLKFINGNSGAAKILRGVLVALAIQIGLIAVALIGVTTALGAFSVAAGIATAASSAFGAALIGTVGPALAGLGKAAAAFGFLAAKIAILGLLLEDLWVTLNGGDSLFSRIAEWTGGIEFMTRQFQLWADIWDWITGGITTASDILKDMADFVPDWLKNFLGFGGADMAVNPMQTITQAAAQPPSNQRGGMGGSTVSQTNDVNINVNGARDPASVANDVNKAMQRSYADAAYSLPVTRI